MAQENDELLREMQNLQRTMQGLGTSTESTSKTLADLSSKVASVTRSFGSAAKALGESNAKFTSMNGAIDLTTKAISTLAPAFKDLAGIAGDSAKALAAQTDALVKNYQDLGAAGALAADGIEGVQKRLTETGLYSLPAFIKAVNQNTQSMVTFGGTVSDGSQQFAKLAGNLTSGDVAKGFINLGMSIDDIGDGAAKYVSAFSRYGLTQKQTFEQLQKSTADYMVEVDAITRLTGETRQQQEASQQKLLTDTRFRATIAEMEAKGQGDNARQLEALIKGVPGPLQDIVRASVAGTLTSKQSVEAEVLYQGQIRKSIEATKNGANALDEITNINRAGAKGAEKFGTSLKFTTDFAQDWGYAVFDSQAAIKAQDKLQKETNETTAERIKREQDELKNSGKDSPTGKLTAAQIALGAESKNVQELQMAVVMKSIGVIKWFTETLSKGTEMLNKIMPFAVSSHGPGGTTYRGPGEPGGGTARGTSDNAQKALAYFMAQGYTKEQAAGLVGNLQVESGKNLDVNAVGDGGKAKGIAQWHPDRQANFKKVTGKEVGQSTLEDQLKFVDWELKNTEKSAGDKLKQAKTAAEAAKIVDNSYERSSGTALADRIASANALSGMPANATAATTAPGSNTAVPAAPTNGYQPQVNANATQAAPPAPAPATPATPPAPMTGTSAEIHLAKMVADLDELVALQRQSNAIENKILQRSS